MMDLLLAGMKYSPVTAPIAGDIFNDKDLLVMLMKVRKKNHALLGIQQFQYLFVPDEHHTFPVFGDLT
jgi:hypothetical protein